MRELPGRKRLVAPKFGRDALPCVHFSVGTGTDRAANVL
jgi:hypothetical protein